MLAYRDKSERAKGLRERSSLTLEDICGLEPGLPYEGLVHTLAIVCLSQAVMLGFDSREAMCAWDARIRYALGEVHRFHVTVAPGTKLESGPATLHLCNDILVVARDVPPAVAGQWKLSDLRRYGAVPNGFIFEGGTRCGYWAGVFFLSSAEGERISFLFDCIVRGISPTKGPFGLRPVLPDLSPGGPATVEERVAQEALETLQLEKRLSLLSHSVRPGSGGGPWPGLCGRGSGPGASAGGLGLNSFPTTGDAAWTAEYQVPTALRPHYDTPRSLRQAPRDQTPASQGGPDDGTAGDSGGQMSAGCPSSWLGGGRRGQATDAPGSEATLPSPAPSEPWGPGGPHTGPPLSFFSTCPVCGGLKGAAASPPGVPVTHSGAPGPEGPRSEAHTYVNVPVSPSSPQQLHYLGLQLQAASAGIRGAGASRYAQIDILATEAAHRAGALHAHTRKERLHDLEQRRKGVPR
uniref:Protein Dok-7 n=1 Tax=Camelus bactrianus TaxID=9837 RepID=A0A9W3GC56_CAMBA|nr:protein Dok-7 [Camelus bactrianus]